MARVKAPSQVDFHKPLTSHPSHIAFQRLSPREEPSEKARAIIAHLREMMKEFINKKPDKSWAQRVLDRHAAGEHIFPLGLQWAREVAAQQPEREPGSDDE